MSVHGNTADGFDAVRSVMAASIASGADIGASYCATKNGETIIDIWGGHADAAKTRDWDRDTIVNVYSTTKTMTALVALMLADRGVIDFDERVAAYWPEFAAEGKADVTVAHLMSHASGLSGWKEPLQRDDLYDWQKCIDLLARQAPFWEPGTAAGYHGVTQGYLVGEVIRRATGKTVGTIFREEIAEPLGADFHIGLPASEDARVGELIPPPSEVDASPASELQKNMARNPGIDVGATTMRAWRGAEIPAAGGTGNARSVAQVHAILANGGTAGGKTFLSEAGCRRALDCQIEGMDLVLGIPVRYGMGFGLAGGMVPLPNASCCYWGGYGGSIAIIDMEAHTTFAYVMNRMEGTTTGDARGFALVMATMQAMAA
jgi:CubicO group peptidase (beta-lactamase class C family)